MPTMEAAPSSAPLDSSATRSRTGISVLAGAVLLVADNVGTGVLALPGQAHVLGGHVAGATVIVIMAPMCWYMGHALHRSATLIEKRAVLLNDAGTQQQQQPPERVADFFGLAARLYGPQHPVARLTAFLYYLTLFLQMGSYLVVLSHALQAAVRTSSDMCRPVASLASAALLLTVNQLPSFAAVARGPALLSVLAILAVSAICVSFAGASDSTSLGAPPPAPPPPPDAPWFAAVDGALRKAAATGGVLFAEATTVLLLNSRHALASPERIGTALALALGVMCVGFVGVVLGSGRDPPAFLFDAVPATGGGAAGGAWRRVAAVLLFGHVAISYAISSVALGSAIQRRLHQHQRQRQQQRQRPAACDAAPTSGTDTDKPPRATDDADAGTGVAGGGGSGGGRRLEWFGLTTALMLSVWLLASAAPFFSGLVDLIGSLNLCTFFLPSLFLRRAHDLTRTPLPAWERALTALLMGGSLCMTVVGVTGSIVDVVRAWGSYGLPFACHAG